MVLARRPAWQRAATAARIIPPAVDFILTYHVEGERETPSGEVFAEIGRQVGLADDLGYHAAWFAEHHFHVHRGHLPNPVLFAVHLAARTHQIRLGSAVICTALHHPLRLA
jgi:alkanesulfonate monooxygenase SsuD/methylene tetrahydromethanopterin reductase-like flavin-dependent oxidoreductase (luciferase family)